jgi:hypothetical protein
VSIHTSGLPRAAHLFSAAVALVAVSAAPANALESKSYAVEWFSVGSYSQDGDCPGGVNPPTRVQYAESYELLGYSPDQVKKLMEDQVSDDQYADARATNILRFRGRLNGEPVNAFVHPWSVADPGFVAINGKYSFGFDLDGKQGPKSFIEPRTKQTGIDNELFRAVGCIEQFRGTYNFRPTFWDFIWGSMKETTPAWLITVSGEDLDKDGPVTVTFDRAIEQLAFGPAGDLLADATYRIDPDPRSHHEFNGEIKDRVLTISKGGDLTLLLDTLAFNEFRLHNTHLRMDIEPSGRLNGLIGGYQPWGDVYFGIANGGLAYENMIVNDITGIYWLLRKHADAMPDPKTGENMAISSAYRIEAVPVFAVPADQAK